MRPAARELADKIVRDCGVPSGGIRMTLEEHIGSALDSLMEEHGGWQKLAQLGEQRIVELHLELERERKSVEAADHRLGMLCDFYRAIHKDMADSLQRAVSALVERPDLIGLNRWFLSETQPK